MRPRLPAVPPAATPGGAVGPLRPVSLMLQGLVLVTAEVFLYRSYTGHDAAFHWSTHFLIGVIAAVLWHAAYLYRRGTPAPGQLLSVLGFHVVAMAPDLAFRAGVPHYRWMDVFLGHVSSHYVPGGDRTWLVLACVLVLAYTVQLARWAAGSPTDRRLGRGGRPAGAVQAAGAGGAA